MQALDGREYAEASFGREVFLKVSQSTVRLGHARSSHHSHDSGSVSSSQLVSSTIPCGNILLRLNPYQRAVPFACKLLSFKICQSPYICLLMPAYTAFHRIRKRHGKRLHRKGPQAAAQCGQESGYPTSRLDCSHWKSRADPCCVEVCMRREEGSDRAVVVCVL